MIRQEEGFVVVVIPYAGVKEHGERKDVVQFVMLLEDEGCLPPFFLDFSCFLGVRASRGL